MKIIMTLEIPDAALEKEGVTASEIFEQFQSEAQEMKEVLGDGASIKVTLEPFDS